jgi:hypothetical protein
MKHLRAVLCEVAVKWTVGRPTETLEGGGWGGLSFIRKTADKEGVLRIEELLDSF